jgi:hypothetical protein
VTLPIIMGLTKALRDAKVTGAASKLMALLQAFRTSLHAHSDPLAAFSISSTDAGFLLCRLDSLGLRPRGTTKSARDSKSDTAAGQAAGLRDEVPLATLLTRQLVLHSQDVPPGLLVCATLASSALLGYMHVPLVKVRALSLHWSPICLPASVLRCLVLCIDAHYLLCAPPTPPGHFYQTSEAAHQC